MNACPFCGNPRSTDPNFYACGTFHAPGKEPMRSATCEWLEEKTVLMGALRKIRERCRGVEESRDGDMNRIQGWWVFAVADDALKRTE